MQENLKFININSPNHSLYNQFEQLFFFYVLELDNHNNGDTPKQYIKDYLNKIFNNNNKHFLYLCYYDNLLIGFFYGKLDNESNYTLLSHKKGVCGFVVEFYILPLCRKKGFGTTMYTYLENLFITHNVLSIYLTPDEITGKPFWLKQGFIKTNKILFTNNRRIYKKIIKASNN